MNDKTGKLLRKVEKAGIRQSLKRNHVLDRSELLALKVQVVPWGWRTAFGMASVGAGVAAYFLEKEGSPVWALLAAAAACVLLLFAVLGVKRTVSSIVDNLDVSAAGDVIELGLRGIGAAVGALLD